MMTRKLKNALQIYLWLPANTSSIPTDIRDRSFSNNLFAYCVGRLVPSSGYPSVFGTRSRWFTYKLVRMHETSRLTAIYSCIFFTVSAWQMILHRGARLSSLFFPGASEDHIRRKPSTSFAWLQMYERFSSTHLSIISSRYWRKVLSSDLFR